MTDIEKKALALLNEIRAGYGFTVPITYDWFNADSFEHLAFLRAIEQHEAFRQEVSDAVLSFWKYTDAVPGHFKRFIIAKPDPLVEAMLRAWPQYADRLDACSNDAAAFRAAIEKRGGKIVWGER